MAVRRTLIRPEVFSGRAVGEVDVAFKVLISGLNRRPGRISATRPVKTQYFCLVPAALQRRLIGRLRRTRGLSNELREDAADHDDNRPGRRFGGKLCREIADGTGD